MGKIRYPKHRKSPYKHRVRSHTRKGRLVRSYERGKGERPLPAPRRRPVSPRSSGQFFRVRILYSDGGVETVIVNASSYLSAIDKGLMERRRLGTPYTIALARRM